jgi:hypothetical protein
MILLLLMLRNNALVGWEGKGSVSFNRYFGVTADVSGATLSPFSACRRRPIPISIKVFFGNTTSCPRAMKFEYTDTPAPYAPIA